MHACVGCRVHGGARRSTGPSAARIFMEHETPPFPPPALAPLVALFPSCCDCHLPSNAPSLFRFPQAGCGQLVTPSSPSILTLRPTDPLFGQRDGDRGLGARSPDPEFCDAWCHKSPRIKPALVLQRRGLPVASRATDAPRTRCRSKELLISPPSNNTVPKGQAPLGFCHPPGHPGPLRPGSPQTPKGISINPASSCCPRVACAGEKLLPVVAGAPVSRGVNLAVPLIAVGTCTSVSNCKVGVGPNEMGRRSRGLLTLTYVPHHSTNCKSGFFSHGGEKGKGLG